MRRSLGASNQIDYHKFNASGIRTFKEASNIHNSKIFSVPFQIMSNLAIQVESSSEDIDDFIDENLTNNEI